MNINRVIVLDAFDAKLLGRNLRKREKLFPSPLNWKTHKFSEFFGCARTLCIKKSSSGSSKLTSPDGIQTES